MLVLFRSAAEQRLFSTERLLFEQFGERLGRKIQLRLLVLGAAINLAMVPTRPPVGFKIASQGGFTIDLSPSGVLRFSAKRPAHASLSNIEEIVILGVETTAQS